MRRQRFMGKERAGKLSRRIRPTCQSARRGSLQIENGQMNRSVSRGGKTKRSIPVRVRGYSFSMTEPQRRGLCRAHRVYLVVLPTRSTVTELGASVKANSLDGTAKGCSTGASFVGLSRLFSVLRS